MKRILYLTAVLFAAMLASAVVSCEKDTTDDAETASLTVSFNTGSLYEELGIHDLVAGVVAPGGGYSIIDSVLVYDQNGRLVGKTGVESSSLERKELPLEEIPEGSYTLILWQSVCRADGVRAWKTGEEETLSTLQITSDGASFGYQWALGVALASVTYGGQSMKVEMKPVSVGSIIDVTIDNYTEDSGYKDMAMVGGHHISGIYLDPFRQESRWVKSEYLGVLFRLYPENQGHSKFFTLFQGTDLNLTIRGDKNDGFDDVGSCPHKTLTPGENYTVYFDMARSTWQPAFFGSAGDFAVWKADRDAGLLVFDPLIDWGCSLAEVAEHVYSKAWWKEQGQMTLSGSRWYKVYWVSDTLYEIYAFETEDGQNMNYVICHCDEPAVPIEQAQAMVLHQGYVNAGKIQFPDKDPYDLYFSEDKVTEVFIKPYEDGSWRIIYQPTDPDDLQYII